MNTENTKIIIQALALVETREELGEIFSHFKTAEARVARSAARSFRKGQTVNVELKHGKVGQGVVVKVNQKTVGVSVTSIDGSELPYPQEWRVSPSHLKAVS